MLINIEELKSCLCFSHPTLLFLENIWLIKVTNLLRFSRTFSRLFLDELALLDAEAFGSDWLWVWLLILLAAVSGLRALMKTGNGVVTSGRRAVLKQDSQQVDP